jgi:hypothetical protein
LQQRQQQQQQVQSMQCSGSDSTSASVFSSKHHIKSVKKCYDNMQDMKLNTADAAPLPV